MNIKQAYNIFVIAQEGSVTAAAKKLYVSQPSLSQMLKSVESELGVSLFDRSVSPMRLTYAGEHYLEAAREIIAANEKLETQLNAIRNQNSGRLRLGMSVQRSTQVLPGALPEFLTLYPNVKLELTEGGSDSLEQKILAGEIDLMLAAVESVSPTLTYEIIEKEVVGILAGKDSLLAKEIPSGIPITLEQTRGNHYISLKQGHSVRVVQDKLFRQSGFSPDIILETDSLEIGKRVCLSTGACMICSIIYIDEFVRKSGGSFYPLANYENHRHFYACYRNGQMLPRYATDFVRIVTKVLEEQKLAASK